MPGFNINEFQSQLVGGGARPSLFRVEIQNPVAPISNLKTPFMVQTAQIPESTLMLCKPITSVDKLNSREIELLLTGLYPLSMMKTFLSEMEWKNGLMQ